MCFSRTHTYTQGKGVSADRGIRRSSGRNRRGLDWLLDIEKLLHTKIIIQKSMSIETIIEERGGVVIAAVVLPSQKPCQSPSWFGISRRDLRYQSRGALCSLIYFFLDSGL
jgi:hypothetical protein